MIRMQKNWGVMFLIVFLMLEGVVMQNQTYSCDMSTTQNIYLGGPKVFCVHIVWADKIFVETVVDIPATNTTNASTETTQTLPVNISTYAFNTTVDDFSAFKIGNLSTKLNGYSQSNIWAVIQGSNSDVYTSMLIYVKNYTISRNVFSFVVNIDGGNITKITNDNADCGACDSTQECTERTNWECFDKTVYPTGSDPRFFISWIGSDVNGDYMLSHTKRLSRFSQYSIGSIYNKAKNFVTG